MGTYIYFDLKDMCISNKDLFNAHSNIFHLCTYLNFVILFVMACSTRWGSNYFNIRVIVFVLLRGCGVTWLSGHWMILKFI